MPKNPRQPTKEESELFKQAVADIKPNPSNKPKKHHRTTSLAQYSTSPIVEKFYQRYARNDYLETISGETYLQFNQNLPHKTLRKLRQGQYNAEAILDLHGYTVNEAALALDELLIHSFNTGKRILRIVHGKGPNAILKTQVNTWLQDTPDILAFCSAKPKDGGTGALYILLKKQANSEDDDDDDE